MPRARARRRTLPWPAARPALSAGALGVVLGIGAALFDAEPLWVPAVALVALAAGTTLWVALSARGVALERTLGARRVIEGETVDIVLRLRAGRLPLPSGSIEDPLLSEPATLRPGRRFARVRIQARFGRRGRRRLEPPRAILADPLGLACREVVAAPDPGDDEILVLPRIEPVRMAAGDGDAARLARRGRPVAGAEVEPDGIRPLREGTSASRIFWPSVARGAPAQERRMTADGDRRPVVVLDPRGAATEEHLDAAVRAAASLAHHLAARGGCGLLLPGDRRAAILDPTLAGWAHVHARLALVQPGPGLALGAVAHRRGAVLFVSARVSTRLPATLAGGAGATRVLIVPAQLPRAAAFAVAGCHGYVLGAARRRGARGPVTGLEDAA